MLTLSFPYLDDGHITRNAMNGFSFSDICCLLCCPPVPSRIAAKLAFVPPEPSYAIITKVRYPLHPAPPDTALRFAVRHGPFVNLN